MESTKHPNFHDLIMSNQSFYCLEIRIYKASSRYGNISCRFFQHKNNRFIFLGHSYAVKIQSNNEFMNWLNNQYKNFTVDMYGIKSCFTLINDRIAESFIKNNIINGVIATPLINKNWLLLLILLGFSKYYQNK